MNSSTTRSTIAKKPKIYNRTMKLQTESFKKGIESIENYRDRDIGKKQKYLQIVSPKWI